MRDYVLNRAAGLGQAGAGSLVRQMYENWVARRSVGRLSGLDDFLLRDIGVAREDVEWASGLPLTVNAATALEERANARGRNRSRRR